MESPVDYRMLPREPRRELPPIVPAGDRSSVYGPPSDRMDKGDMQNRYPETHHLPPHRPAHRDVMADFSDQEYNDRMAWDRDRDRERERERQHNYYADEMDPRDSKLVRDKVMRAEDRAGEYSRRHGSEMREMRELPPDREVRHHPHHPHDRDYPSPHRGQTMVHRDIL